MSSPYFGMKTRFPAVLMLVLVSALCRPSQAQNVEFTDAKAQLSLGTGLFTFHGPANLLATDSPGNLIHETDPAIALLGSFPLLQKWVHFRFMLLFTNFETAHGQRIVGTGRNDFLTKNLLVFEPTLVFNLRSLSTESVIPYVFTGFGGTIADAFGNRRDTIDRPGTGIPGPERSVFHIPVGLGVDYRITERLLLFGEASWRMDMNYVFKNERDYEPHSTTLFIAGIKAVIGKRIPCTGCDIRDGMDFVPPIFILPPLKHDVPVRSCEIGDLTPILFDGDSATLTDAERKVLDDNFDALFKLRDCCADIEGVATGKDLIPAIRLADERAQAIRDYLLAKGLSASRFRITVETISERTCKAKGGGNKCPNDILVTIIPMDCANFALARRPERDSKDPEP